MATYIRPYLARNNACIAFEGDVTIPDANKFTILLDTTLTAVADSAASYPNVKANSLPTSRAAGAPNETAIRKRFTVGVKCTGANVFLHLKKCDPFLAWEEQSSVGVLSPASSPVTIVAGDGTAYYVIEGNGTSGVQVSFEAGATPPTTLACTVQEEII